MEKVNTDLLLLDEELSVPIMEENFIALKPFVTEFVESYAQNQDKPVEEWLNQKMGENLPEKTPDEIQEITKDIISVIEATDEKQKSLEDAIENGRSKESWFASETKKYVASMSMQETEIYLSDLDHALIEANEALHHTITTKNGTVSQSPNLDGFIAEQYHAQTFNMNAKATESPYRAEVLEPNGKGYAKNSVDIKIVDDNGRMVRRYQSKYCRDAKATLRAWESGDYRGQQFLVSKGQENEVPKKCTTFLEAPDGTTSNPLSKSSAKQLQTDAQTDNWKGVAWNEYRTKEVARGIAKSAGSAALQGAAIGVGIDIAQKLCRDGAVDGDEIIETAITTGADSGIKAATAGAIKVGAEKGFISAALKETAVAGGVAVIAVENVKVIGEMMSGELTPKEGFEKIEQTTVSTVAGLAASTKGAAIGATVGAVLGPVGSCVGGFVGGMVSYMAGSKLGETVVRGVQKVRDVVVEAACTVVEGVGAVIGGLFDFVGSLFW